MPPDIPPDEPEPALKPARPLTPYPVHRDVPPDPPIMPPDEPVDPDDESEPQLAPIPRQILSRCMTTKRSRQIHCRTFATTQQDLACRLGYLLAPLYGLTRH